MKPLRSAGNVAAPYTRPQGKRADALLNSYRVECMKSSGIWVLFSRYPTREEAQMVSDCLAGLGQPVRVVAPK